MPLVEKSENRIKVNEDGPSPLPEIANWLNDMQPSKTKVRILASATVLAASEFCDVLGSVVGVLELVFEVCAHYCSDFEIVPTKYVIAPTTQLTVSSTSSDISNE